MLYPMLTRPITIGALSLKNRMAMSPMATFGMADPDGASNERHRAYYAERARSGLGLIRIEATLVHLSGKSWGHHLAIHDDRFIPGLAELARAIKSHGPAAFVQLHHGGRVAREELSGCRPLAPSPLPAPGRPVPKEMTIKDIETIVEAYGQGARRAREAGFDGVELHMGTAYLLVSFISPAQNVRQDEYGRDFAGRMRFPLRIIQRIRELAGPDCPIGARIVGSDWHDGGIDLPYCQRVAKTLEEAGLAYLCVSSGQGPNGVRDSTLAMGYGQGVLADFAAAVKSAVSVPVMTVGRYHSLAAAEAVLAAGKADVAVFGRALLADPDLVGKSLRGEEDQIIPCIACESCGGFSGQSLGTTCIVNPGTGHEHEPPPEPAVTRRRVLVLGSGLPGLEIARVAARRGYDVTVATAGLPFGGLLALRAQVPGAEEVGRGVKYFRQALAGLGVRVVDEPPAEPADVVVDVRPGSPLALSIPGLDRAAVVDGEDVLAGRVATDSLGHRVAVVGPGLFAGETALFLAGAGKAVTLLATGERPMQDGNPLVAGKTALRLAARGGQTIAGARLLSAADSVLTVEADGERTEVGPFDQIVAALGWQPPAPSGIGEAYVLADAWEALAELGQMRRAASLARGM